MRAADYGTRAVAYILDELISWAWTMLLAAVVVMAVLTATKLFTVIPALAVLALWLGLLLFGFIGGPTFYIGILVDLLCPLWDRNKQTLHDKVVGDTRRPGAEARASVCGSCRPAPCEPGVNRAATAFVV